MKNKNGLFTQKWVFLVSITIAVSLFHHCVLMKPEGGPKIIVSQERENLGDASIMVFNFKEPGYADHSGKEVAELFHLRLLETKKFKVVSLFTDSNWDRIADSEEERLLLAIREAKDKQFDYILVGDLKEYFFGGINPSRVQMKIRVIEVTTQTTTFLATYSLEQKGKDPSYPLQTKLSQQSQTPKALAEKMVRLLVDKINTHPK